MDNFYLQLLYVFMEQQKFEEKDYHNLVTSLWNVDSNLLDEKDFNPKWVKVCEELQITPQYDDKEKYHLSDKNVTLIATALFRNRHTFQQYLEESERRRKRSDEIMNEPKYNY